MRRFFGYALLIAQAFFASLALLAGASPEAWSGTLPRIQRQVLPNGVVLIVSPEHTLPFVTVRFVIDAGARNDPQGRAGLANLTAQGLLLGTPERSARQIDQQIDRMGAELSASCGLDYASVDFKVLKGKWPEGIELFLDIITRPAFPEGELRRKIRALQSALAEEEDQPGVVAEKAFRQALFQHAPYGHAVAGTIESLAALSVDQVRGFHDQYYKSSGATLVIVGDVEEAEVRQVAERLGRWNAPGTAVEGPLQVFRPSPGDVRIDRKVAQANIVLGNPGIARSNPDFYAAVVMNEILGGGGFTSRLLRHIRVQEGLAYSVYSFFAVHEFPGSFQIVLQTKNDSAAKAIRIAREEMRKMQQEPAGDQELETAKSHLIGTFPLRYATQSGLAQLLGFIEYYRLGFDYFSEYAGRIQRITRQDVQEAARKYLQPEQAIVAIVADLQAAGMQK